MPIKPTSPAGKYLISRGIKPEDFNSYGSRRGNDLVMTRGTFANVRIKNLMVPGTEGGVTKYFPNGNDGEVMSIFDAAMKYEEGKTPLVILAGTEYGTGSSRDWAAKGTRLAGSKSSGRRELRTNPPLESGRHGRFAAAIPRRHERADRSDSMVPRNFRSPVYRTRFNPGRN